MADSAPKPTGKPKKGFRSAKFGVKSGENVPLPGELQVDITTTYPETAVGPSLFSRGRPEAPKPELAVPARPIMPPGIVSKLNVAAIKEKPKSASVLRALPKKLVQEPVEAPVVAPVVAPVTTIKKVVAPPPPPVPAPAAVALEGEEYESLLPPLKVTEEVAIKPKVKRPKPKKFGNPELQRLKESINIDFSKDPYETSKEEAFVPEDRQAFSMFINKYFKGFKLPPTLDKEIDPNACLKKSNVVEVYAYQKFVRDYMRQASPYRGVLVYHGLGSGKTCTSIAAAEALYSQSNKKLIVMTPTSLKENFLNELMFCGFRHYRLKNYWVSFPLDDPTIQLFAINAVGLSSDYVKSVLNKKEETQRVLWMPDLSKPETVSNLDDLESWQQSSIRDQLYALLNNKITFIGYTGYTHDRLKNIALNDKTFFDDSVIIIDEIHNLTRLMCGKLDKYLIPASEKAREQMKKKSVTKKKPSIYEPIEVGDWDPKLKGDEQEYERAYLFYRLLVQAKNSKIIALSGTPIVNQPVEIGILANILHGYFNSATVNIGTTNGDVLKAVEKYLHRHPRVNFVSMKTLQGVTQVFFTILEEGYVKVFDEDNKLRGVIYRGEEATPKTIMELFDEISRNFSSIDVEFASRPGVTAKMSTFGVTIENKANYEAIPLMPPTKQEFFDTFVSEADAKIKNRIAFVKRMNGLISYYKGSKESLMPKVIRDEVVRCDMSELTLPQYQAARLQEIKQEKNKKKKNPLMNALELSEKENTSYRFRSRAVCNFAFPKDIERPFPRNTKELKETADVMRGILGDTPTDITGNEHQVENVVDAEREEAREKEEDYEENEEEIEDNLSTVEETPAAVEVAAPPAPKKTGIKRPVLLKPTEPAVAAAEPVKPEVRKVLDYKEKLTQCLETLNARKSLMFKMDPSAPLNEQLRYYSPKFSEMYKRIEASPGSSLVYSTFKTVEGIGVFGMALEANGYTRIRLTGPETDLNLHPDTIREIRENPSGKRYIIYSGDDTIRERQTLINIFNGRFDKLPSKINIFLREMGFMNTKTVTDVDGTEKTETYGNLAGEICKVFMITGAGAEGLSLRNVRTVHIMEPYWNKVRLDQVKGRAIRICSHSDLEYNKDDSMNQRTVEIFTYITVFGPDTKGKLDVTIELNDGNKTTDEYILQIAEEKDTLGRDIQGLLKRGAVDCVLNKQENEKISCVLYSGSINDFLYDPRLKEDIEAQTHVTIEEKEGEEELRATTISIGKGEKKIDYQMIETGGRQLIYAMDDVLFTKPIYELITEDGVSKIRRYKA